MWRAAVRGLSPCIKPFRRRAPQGAHPSQTQKLDHTRQNTKLTVRWSCRACRCRQKEGSLGHRGSGPWRTGCRHCTCQGGGESGSCHQVENAKLNHFLHLPSSKDANFWTRSDSTPAENYVMPHVECMYIQKLYKMFPTLTPSA